MYKCVKIVFLLLGGFFLFTITPTMAQSTGNGISLFDMQCVIEKGLTATDAMHSNDAAIYTFQSGAIYQETASGALQIDSGAKNLGLLKTLARRGYTSITTLDTFSMGNTLFTITMGQKCGHPEVRINGREYANDMGVFEIKKTDDALRLYYYDNGSLNNIKCALESFPIQLTIQQENQLSTTGGLMVTGNLNTSHIAPRINADTIHTIPQAIKQLTSKVPSLTKDPKTYHQLKNAPLYYMIKARGYDWKSAKAELANQAGIKNYRGTKSQNLKIKEFLLNKVEIDVQATSTKAIFLSSAQLKQVKTQNLRKIVTLWGYIRSKERVGLAKEYGLSPTRYQGTRSQNLKLRFRLINKINVKK